MRTNAPLITTEKMSAIFDFSSLLTVILLLICTCAYLRDMRPTIFDGGQVSWLRACYALLLWKDGSSAEGSKLKNAIMLKFLLKLYAHSSLIAMLLCRYRKPVNG